MDSPGERDEPRRIAFQARLTHEGPLAATVEEQTVTQPEPPTCGAGAVKPGGPLADEFGDGFTPESIAIEVARYQLI